MHDFIDTEFIYKHSMLQCYTTTLDQKTKMADFQLRSGEELQREGQGKGSEL